MALAAGCDRGAQQTAVDQVSPPKASLPLTSAEAPPSAAAPGDAALPEAPPARVARLDDPGQRYAYADLAYDMSDAFGDAPPDYTYDYDGVRPWVWQSDEGDYEVAEPVEGGYRYYYYRQGDDVPFLIRDTDYAYGFDNGQLVVVYDRGGRPLPFDEGYGRAALAGRMLFRATALFDAARREQHQGVARQNWINQQQAVEGGRQAWANQVQSDPDWRAYHEANAPQGQDRWAEERMRRAAEASRTFQSMNNPAAAAQAAQQVRDAQAVIQQRRSAPQPAGQPTTRQPVIQTPATQAQNATPPAPPPTTQAPSIRAAAPKPRFAAGEGQPGAGPGPAERRAGPPRPEGTPRPEGAQGQQVQRTQPPATPEARRQVEAQTPQPPQEARRVHAPEANPSPPPSRQAELQARPRAETQAPRPPQEAAHRAAPPPPQPRPVQAAGPKAPPPQARAPAAPAKHAEHPAVQAKGSPPPEHGEKEHKPPAAS